MKYYQNNGMGVNSEALRLEAQRRGLHIDESVYVWHGGDDLRTYDFAKRLISNGSNLMILYPTVEGYSNIYDFYFNQKLVPFIQYRSCTDKWKVQPLRRYYKEKGEPYTLFIGFDADEKHRIFESPHKNVEFRFPLIEWGLHRRDCEKIVQDEYGDFKPIKSGCFFCPRQSKESWWALARDQPELFWKAVKLDENSPNIGLLPNDKNGRRQYLRELYPPPITFEELDLGCQYCVFGILPSRMAENTTKDET